MFYPIPIDFNTTFGLMIASGREARSLSRKIVVLEGLEDRGGKSRSIYIDVQRSSLRRYFFAVGLEGPPH